MMRTRTHYCPHGFQIPGPPEPWIIPASKGGADLKASRFCLKCWEKHGQVFLARGFPRIFAEDACAYGFLNLIQRVLKNHAWYRDQDRYEWLETELRMHLLEKRSRIEKVIRESPKTANAYVREALLNKLQDLQADDSTEFQVESNSIEQELLDVDQCVVNGSVVSQQADFDDSDESQLTEQIVAVTGRFDSSSDDDSGVGRSHKAARVLTAHGIVESAEQSGNAKDPLRRAFKQTNKAARKKENAELVRSAIAEQSHRLDALTVVTQKEQSREVSKAHKQLLTAVNNLPHDEQVVIRLRFLEGSELRDGKPRPRPDIIRELRISGNGSSAWSEWDLRRLEQQALIRLRRSVKVPAVFLDRD